MDVKTRVDTFKRTMMVWPGSEIDHHNAQILKNKIDNEIICGGIKNVIFNFEDTVFMDSSGIGVLIGRYKLVRAVGGKIYIMKPSREIERIVKMSGLSKLFEEITDVEELVDEK